MKFVLLLMAFVWFEPLGFAQVDPQKVDHRVDAKDSPGNDPEKASGLTLNKLVHQSTLARKALEHGIFGGYYLSDFFRRVFQLHYDQLLKFHPDWFDYLKIHEARYVPKQENGPALVNADFEYKKISDKAYGFCWGFATLVRDFNVLAFYDPNQARSEQIQFYKDKIDDLVYHHRATVFPGFRDFRELSLVPELNLYLKLVAMELWGQLSVRIRGGEVYLRTRRDLKPQRVKTVVEELEAKLSRHEMPKIIFASEARTARPLSLSKYIHVVLVYGIKHETDGSTRIQIWDVNFFSETLEKSPKELIVTPKGEILYHPWHETDSQYTKVSDQIARIQIAPENDFETVEHLLALRQFCSDRSNARYCQFIENN